MVLSAEVLGGKGSECAPRIKIGAEGLPRLQKQSDAYLIGYE